MADLEALAARPWSRSLAEEFVGIGWAILASVSHFMPLTVFAWSMAMISWVAAVIFALRARASTQGKE